MAKNSQFEVLTDNLEEMISENISDSIQIALKLSAMMVAALGLMFLYIYLNT